MRPASIILASIFGALGSGLILLLTRTRFELVYRQFSAFHTFERDRIVISQISGNILVASFLVLLTTLFLSRKWWIPILVLLFFDLSLFNSRYLYSINREVFPQDLVSFSPLPRTVTAQDRILSYQDIDPFTGLGNYWENMTLRPPFAESFFSKTEMEEGNILRQRLKDLSLNWNMVFNVPSPNGYATFLLADYADFLSGGNDKRLNTPDWSNVPSGKLNELSVAHFLTEKGLTENADALPRARIEDADGVVLPAEILTSQPERILIRVVATEPSTLVLADAYYPGWEAAVDGVPTRVEPKGAFRSVRVPAGESLVEFRFRPRSVAYGLLITLAAIVLAILFV